MKKQTMSTKQTLPEIKTLDFNGHTISLIERNDDFWMMMNDIGKCLDYSDPRIALQKIYSRNKTLFNQYSTMVRLGAADGKTHLQRVFNEKGMMLIAMKSHQPKAADFQIWVVETLSSLRDGKHLEKENDSYKAMPPSKASDFKFKDRTMIPFMGNELILINKKGKPYVAIRLIVQGMGLDWFGECNKIRANEDKYGVIFIVMTGRDYGLCMPLNNLNAYLLSINPKKFKRNIRNKIICYQEECLNALLKADWLNQQYKILDEITEYFNQVKISFDKFVEEQKRDEKEFDTLMKKGKALLDKAQNYPDIPTKENIHHA